MKYLLYTLLIMMLTGCGNSRDSSSQPNTPQSPTRDCKLKVNTTSLASAAQSGFHIATQCQLSEVAFLKLIGD